MAVPHPTVVTLSLENIPPHPCPVRAVIPSRSVPQVGKAKAEARLALLRAVGLDVDAWLAGAVRAGEEHPRTPSSTRPGEEEPAGLDPAEFDDYDSDETFEDAEPGHTARTYPYTCRVIFGYQVKPRVPGPRGDGIAGLAVTRCPLFPTGPPGGRAVHRAGRGAGGHRGW